MEAVLIAGGKAERLGAAAEGRPKPLDQGLEFDGHGVESPLDLLNLLQGDRIGRPAPVKVLRGGAMTDLAVTVGRRPVRP